MKGCLACLTPLASPPPVSAGEWAQRAQLHSRTSLIIYNVTRADKGLYRCEVVAPDDTQIGAEININLTIHGTCLNLFVFCPNGMPGCFDENATWLSLPTLIPRELLGAQDPLALAGPSTWLVFAAHNSCTAAKTVLTTWGSNPR